jgi:hypothetical protein
VGGEKYFGLPPRGVAEDSTRLRGGELPAAVALDGEALQGGERKVVPSLPESGSKVVGNLDDDEPIRKIIPLRFPRNFRSCV